MKLIILILILTLNAGCVITGLLESYPMALESHCRYESIKHGQGNWELEERIYRACLIQGGR